jgi:hypothetical protein
LSTTYEKLKQQQYARTYYEKNREVLLAKAREDRAKNPAKYAAYQRSYRERHPERAREIAKESWRRHYALHREQEKERQKIIRLKGTKDVHEAENTVR